MASSRGKYRDVVSALRGSIVDGSYGPRSQLPTRPEMVGAFGVCNATIQRAFSELAADGFIQTRPSGTFVVDHPPHLCNYGVVTAAAGRWSRFCMAVHQAAGMLQSETVRFSEYVTSREVGARENVKRLCRDVCDHRVGALVLLSSLVDVEGTPALEQKGVPRVRGQSLPESDIPAVCMDVLGSFLNRAVEYLTSRGRRRIAHLWVTNDNRPLKEIMAWLRGTGIDVRPYWVHSIWPKSRDETTANVVNVLMQLDGDKRPDALIIHDDNLIDHATAGLMAAGVKVPEDLEVVTHYNYPSVAPTVLPMTRLGFDCRMFLRKCLELIEAQRRGETPPPVTYIPALFENEIERLPSSLQGGDGRRES
jgi:DNA-binding LacI/PurR family transcriptional regulator/DNA-binding transcriptional regulator YhcF (GntR family)